MLGALLTACDQEKFLVFEGQKRKLYKVGDKILVRKDGILRKNHEPLSQFIRMEQSGLNAETSLKDLIYDE